MERGEGSKKLEVLQNYAVTIQEFRYWCWVCRIELTHIHTHKHMHTYTHGTPWAHMHAYIDTGATAHCNGQMLVPLHAVLADAP